MFSSTSYTELLRSIFHNELFTSTFSGQQFIPSFYQVVKVYNLQVYISYMYRVVDVENSMYMSVGVVYMVYLLIEMADPSLLTTLI